MCSAGPKSVSPKAPIRSRWHSLSVKIRWVIFILATLVIGVRLALPSTIKAYVNRQLAKTPQYAGSIGDVDVHLWRGAYQIQNIAITKTDGQVPVPLFAARTLDLSLEWREIFHGALVGEIILDRAEIHFVAGPTVEQTQTGEEGNWVKTVESLFPFKINRLQINQGKIHFENFNSIPPVNIFINEVTATATNLTNTRDLTQPLPSGLLVRGKTLGGGNLDLQLQMNPLAILPTFEISAQVTNINLIALNDFLKAYGKFDVERGTFALYSSFAVADGKYDGYAKVFFENLDVFAWEKERKKNALQVFWQAVVGGVSIVFRNLPNDQLATKIPISGSYEGSNIGTWTAVTTLLKNAFISALVPKLDQTITVEEVKVEKGGEEPPISCNRPNK